MQGSRELCDLCENITSLLASDIIHTPIRLCVGRFKHKYAAIPPEVHERIHRPRVQQPPCAVQHRNLLGHHAQPACTGQAQPVGGRGPKNLCAIGMRLKGSLYVRDGYVMNFTCAAMSRPCVSAMRTAGPIGAVGSREALRSHNQTQHGCFPHVNPEKSY
jgi:hypothetical protein